MHRRTLRHRRVEDVEYWRQRSGWFDDDEAMRKYNNGVYDTYFQDGGNGGQSGGSKNVLRGAKGKTIVANIIKILAIALCSIMLIYMVRVFCNRLGGSESSSKEKKKRSSSSTRSRSKSRSRSRSRSRKRDSGDYKIMEDDRSRRSSRSKSRSRSSRSRSRPRSKSRSRQETEKKSDPVNPVLV